MGAFTYIETDTGTNVDISAATAVGAYTSTGDKLIMVDVSIDQVAGNGDYVMYVTRQIGGSGSAYVILPKTTMAAASGETAISGQSGWITVRNGDVLTCYIDGLAGDTSTPDWSTRWFELAAITAATIADAVWDELLAGHIIPGSAGAILADGATDAGTVLALLSTSPSLLQQRCMNNDDLICRKSGDFVASFIYLGDLSGVTNLYFTVKPQTLVNSLPDNQATIQIQEGVGLLYINGGVAGVPANGSITITDAPAGHITINLDAVETAKLTANTKYRYDIKADHNILAEGAFFVQSAITLTV